MYKLWLLAKMLNRAYCQPYELLQLIIRVTLVDQSSCCSLLLGVIMVTHSVEYQDVKMILDELD